MIHAGQAFLAKYEAVCQAARARAAEQAPQHPSDERAPPLAPGATTSASMGEVAHG